LSALLELRGLRKDFGTGLFKGGRKVQALAGIDLVVATGETVGIVGESGCGKTTLARCALHLSAPTAGSVHFDGQDLLKLPPAELRNRRREFQIVFQDPFASLDPRMTAAEILAEPFAIHGMGNRERRAARMSELLREVGLDDSVAGRIPAQLSGGQQQRIAIARSLALQPRLLIADEPVSALDASVQAQILNLLANLRRSLGLTLIMISHSLPVIRYLCTRVVVMYLGRIVEEAGVEEFFRGPRHPYSQALLESMPAMKPGSHRMKPVLRGEVPSPAAPPPGCPFNPRCPRAWARCREERPALEPVQGTSAAKVACFLYPGGASLT
jgi:oligopeptide/dipeptide ABC transporter ATP-binding protein